MPRKSHMVRLHILGAIAAAALSGCASSPQAAFTETGRCVDQNGQILPDSACAGAVSSNRYPHWVYGGSVYRRGRRISTGQSEIGGTVRGATSTPMSGATLVSHSGRVIRGGFGSTGSGGRSRGGSGGFGGFGGFHFHGGGS